ncbi:Isocitrate dehydrogenase [NADP], mitochondrial precursor (Oxalosuccinate decarboxylase) [Chytriomyces hyalinus]|nr:Isocitrate dehydrogenase [NADP], mitochondrial precursor (Oxalosuccinate decarboxylase) [Chytriomyces hyalinus]
MRKVTVARPIVEMDGDEMAHVLWKWVKDLLVLPFVQVDIEYFDLSLENRNETEGQVTKAAADAIRIHKVGLKCATIDADPERAIEFNLKQLWKSPNGLIRGAVGCAVFREPILLKSVPKLVPGWQQPIIVARHAFGDQYNCSDVLVTVPSSVTITVTPNDQSTPPQSYRIAENMQPGIVLGMYNEDASIADFARSCFILAIRRKLPVFLSTKNTILQVYDRRFGDIFEAVFEKYYKDIFNDLGLTYSHCLIDEVVARALKSSGGFIWACKNYDGDVQSDMVGQGFGSLGLMTSELVSVDFGTVVTEAAHGTVTKHYREYQKGLSTSTNPVAIIYAWSRALSHRAKLDGNKELHAFCLDLERSVIAVIDDRGVVTKDLAILMHGDKLEPMHYVSSKEFIITVQRELMQRRNAF